MARRAPARRVLVLPEGAAVWWPGEAEPGHAQAHAQGRRRGHRGAGGQVCVGPPLVQPRAACCCAVISLLARLTVAVAEPMWHARRGRGGKQPRAAQSARAFATAPRASAPCAATAALLDNVTMLPAPAGSVRTRRTNAHVATCKRAALAAIAFSFAALNCSHAAPAAGCWAAAAAGGRRSVGSRRELGRRRKSRRRLRCCCEQGECRCVVGCCCSAECTQRHASPRCKNCACALPRAQARAALQVSLIAVGGCWWAGGAVHGSRMPAARREAHRAPHARAWCTAPRALPCPPHHLRASWMPRMRSSRPSRRARGMRMPACWAITPRAHCSPLQHTAAPAHAKQPLASVQACATCANQPHTGPASVKGGGAGAHG